MKASFLKKEYPQIWDSIYESMVFDLKECMSGADIEIYGKGRKHSRIHRIAHNAAFLGCYELHKYRKL